MRGFSSTSSRQFLRRGVDYMKDRLSSIRDAGKKFVISVRNGVDRHGMNSRRD